MNIEKEIKVEIPILISEDLKYKLDYISDLEFELAGWLVGKVTREYILLEDILIPKQKVSNGSVDIDSKAGAELVKEFKGKCKNIIGHMHGHNNMGAFWSCGDEDNINKIMEPREFFVFIVSSRKEHLIRLEIRKPFKISVDNLPYEIHSEKADKIKEILNKEIEKKAEKPEPRVIREVIDLTEKEDIKSLGDFEVKVAPGIFARYLFKTLIIEGLDSQQAYDLADSFSQFDPEVEEDRIGMARVIFRLKRKKARKIITQLPAILGTIYDDNYQSNLHGNSLSKYFIK